MNGLWLHFPMWCSLALHVAIAVTPVAACGWIASTVYRKSPALTRHTILLGTLLAVLVAPAFVWRSHFASGAKISAAVPRVEAAPVPLEVAGSTTEDGNNRADAQPQQERKTNWRGKLIIGQALLTLWLLGSLFMLARLAHGLWLLRTLKKSCRSTDERFTAAVAGVSRWIGLRRPPRIFVSSRIPSPVTAGVIRPFVVIPEGMFDDTSTRELDAVLVHELAHIRRRDSLIACLQQFLAIVYWWNPLVSLLVRRLSRTAEEICDQWVVAGGKGRLLAEVLVASADRAVNGNIRYALTSGLLDGTGSIERRVQQLVKRTKAKLPIASRWTMAFVGAVTLLITVTVVRVNQSLALLVVGAPESFGPIVNSAADENSPFLSHDGLTLYFQSPNRVNGVGLTDIYFSTRESLTSSWTAPVNLTAINTPVQEQKPFLTSDGRTMYYDHYDEATDFGVVHRRTRTSLADEWGLAVPLTEPINVREGISAGVYLTSDGLTMVFQSNRPGGSGNFDIWEATRPSADKPWVVTNLGPNVNSSASDTTPIISEDRHTLMFASRRAGGFGDFDIWVSQRNSAEDEWGPAFNAGALVNTYKRDKPSQFWRNLLIFRSDGIGGMGGNDMYYVSIVPEPANCSMSICGILLLVGLISQRCCTRCK